MNKKSGRYWVFVGLLSTVVAVSAGDYEVAFAHVQRMLVQSLKNEETGLNTTRQQLEAMAKPVRQGNKEARALNQQGLDALKKNDLPTALTAFQQAHQLDPGDVEIAANLGYTHLKRSQLKRAEQQLVYAVSLAPVRVASWYNLGQVYGAMAEGDKAAGAFANAYRFSQDRAKTENFIRQGLLAPENNEATRAALRRALQLFGLQP